MKKIYLIVFLINSQFAISQTDLPTFKDNPGLQSKGKVVHADKLEVSSIEDLFDERFKPFYHGVASGDPLQDRVIIWTRIHPETPGPKNILWKVATDVELSNVVRSGEFSTDENRDYTVKIDVTGLEPGTIYYYGFTYDGFPSITGRTRTLPIGEVDRVRLAMVTGTNYAWGYFNGYGRIAARNDLFAVLHTGDYIYEYAKDYYFQPYLEGRDAYPENKCVSLDDYRGRYSQYRLDPDLRRCHQQLPIIAIWDDHEVANDSWSGGAQAHDPETDGDWEARRNNAIKAYFEWMPVRSQSETPSPTDISRKFEFGNLLDLMMLETRLSGRVEPISPKGEGSGLSIDSSEWLDPNRTMLGNEQIDWLINSISSSDANWKIITSSVMMSHIFGFGPIIDGFGSNLMGNQDAWDGYTIERAKILGHIYENNIQNFGVLSGDFHTAFCSYLSINPTNFDFNPVNPQEANPWPQFDAETGSGAIGFEFTTPSITTANLNEQQGFGPFSTFGLPERSQIAQFVEATLQNGNPHNIYGNSDQHGYVTIDFSKEQVQADWWYIENNVFEKEADTLYEAFPNLIRVDTEMHGAGWFVNSGEKKLNEADAPAPSIPNPPAETPLLPPTPNSVDDTAETGAMVFRNFPNPAENVTTFHYILSTEGNVRIKIYNIQGNQVGLAFDSYQTPGAYGVEYDCSDLPNGNYFYVLETAKGNTTRSLIIKR